MSQGKAHTFSLKLTRFIHTPVNTNNGHFSMSRVQEKKQPILYGRPFVSKLRHDIRAVFSHVYLQSFQLRDIRAFFLPHILALFPALWGFYSHVYDYFLTNAHICAHKKAHIYALQTSMWSYKIEAPNYTVSKKPLMYDGAESNFSLKHGRMSR